MTAPTRRKALAFALTLGAAAALGQARRPLRRDAARAGLPLARLFPASFGEWRLDGAAQMFVQPPNENGKLYGVYDQVLERAYLGPQGRRIMLCVAYGSEQSPSLEVHRPEVCYAASGFRVEDVHAAWLQLGSRKLRVTRLHASMLGRFEPITYWTVLGDTVVPDDLERRWQQVLAGLRGEVRDGMLVRISTIDRDAAGSYLVHQRFAADLAGAVPGEHRDRIFGSSFAA